jgi:hypothetical protein
MIIRTKTYFHIHEIFILMKSVIPTINASKAHCVHSNTMVAQG